MANKIRYIMVYIYDFGCKLYKNWNWELRQQIVPWHFNE